MLVIRQEQMNVFSLHMLEGFVGRVAAHLREWFPGQCDVLDEPALREVVRGGVRRAGQYGIRTEFDVWRFVDLMFFYGRDFDAEFPAAVAILADDDLGGNEKVNRLYVELDAVPAESLKEAELVAAP
ncbi:MAG: hypothetical protein ACRD68_14850 [Pyrinomonadaceae bacterium]